ncbi:MAG: MFS transporter [Anaerolineae bacterium]|nr:MFS transporter [Anaerolineae bacterium]
MSEMLEPEQSPPAQTYIRRLRALPLDVKLFLLATSMVGFAIMSGIYPVLFNLYLLRIGYEIEFIGLVNAAGLLAYALLALPSGVLAARLGIRRTMVIGLALSTVCYVLQPLVASIPGPLGATWILTCRILAAVGIALYYVNSIPFLANATRPDERNYAYSVQMAAGTLAGFAGSLLGGALPTLLAPILGVSPDDPAPYRYALVLAATLCVPAVFAMLAVHEPRAAHAQAHQAASPADAAPVALIVIIAFTVLLRASAVGASYTFFNVYLDDELGISTTNIGLLFAAVQLVSAPAAMAMPAFVRRWGNHDTVVYGSLGAAGSLVLLAVIPHWLAAFVGRAGIYAFSSVSDPAFSIYQMEAVSPRWRTLMAGASSLALGLSWTTLAFGGGHLIVSLGYRVLFLSGAGLTLLGTLLFWLYFRRR